MGYRYRARNCCMRSARLCFATANSREYGKRRRPEGNMRRGGKLEREILPTKCSGGVPCVEMAGRRRGANIRPLSGTKVDLNKKLLGRRHQTAVQAENNPARVFKEQRRRPTGQRGGLRAQGRSTAARQGFPTRPFFALSLEVRNPATRPTPHKDHIEEPG